MPLTLEEYDSLIDVGRLEYDPDEATPRLTRTWGQIIDVEFHHTAAPPPRTMDWDVKRRWILDIEFFHEVTKGWSDFFYGVVIFADGSSWAGRHPLRTSQGDINDTMTIHIPGFNPVPTAPQFAEMLRWCKAIVSDPANIRGHLQRPAATACPGPGVLNAIDQLREVFFEPQAGGMDMPYVLEHEDGRNEVILPGKGSTMVSDPTHWAERCVEASVTGIFSSDAMVHLLDDARHVDVSEVIQGVIEEFVPEVRVDAPTIDAAALARELAPLLPAPEVTVEGGNATVDVDGIAEAVRVAISGMTIRDVTYLQ